MTQAAASQSLPFGRPHLPRATWRSVVWRLASMLGLVVLIGACSGGGGGGGGETPAPPPSPPPVTAPAITAQPANVTVTAGQPATFTATASGTAPLTFEWLRNGTAIPGSNSSSYTLTSTALSDSGAQFSVQVSNSAGRVTSSVVMLTVNPVATAPVISTQPLSATAVVGGTATFSVAAAGSDTLNYQWLRNGTAIAGANTASYTTPVLALSDNGATYAVTVSNALGSVTSASVSLSVSALPVGPVITSQPSAVTVAEGQIASFNVAATGSEPLNYQWLRNGAVLSGATSASYSTSVTTLADNGASFEVVVTNSVGNVTSAPVVLTVQAAAASTYWLRGSAGVAASGTLAFANGPQTANSLNLTLVDPAAPSTPLVVEQPGAWLLQASVSEPRLNPQNAGDSVERFLVYARGTRLWRLDLGTASGAPAPQQVGNVSLSELCAQTGTGEMVINFFADTAEGGNSVLQYRSPGADGVCQTADDVFWALRVNASASTAPTVTPRVFAALRNAGGAITGFLARTGNQVQRLDANLGGATNAFTVGTGALELLRQPTGPGLLVFRDGNALRAYDTTSNAAPVNFATADSDFLQLGESGSAPAVALYRNGGRVVSYPLTTTGTLSTVITLAAGETVARAGGDSTQQVLVLASGGSSRLVSVNGAGTVSTIVTETGLIDAGRVGGTPSRWIYTLQSGRVLKSVARTGGEPVTLASSDDLRVFNVGSWGYETVWFDRRGAGGGLLGSEVSALTSLGSPVLTQANAVTVGGASFNGFQDTSVGRIVATPINTNGDRPYAGASLLVLDPVTGATRVTYGALANAAYNTVDVSGLTGPNRPVLITASSVQVLNATTADLYFVRVGATGLQRLTSFVP